MAKYTVYGSTAFDSYIDTVLAHIVARFTETIDCKDIRALILGGGYGRGEGGVLLKSGEQLYNDLDFFVISKALPWWKTKQINSKLQILHHELSDKYGVDIDFSDLKPVSFLPNAPFTMMWYDLKHGHKVVYGKQNILQYLPNWQSYIKAGSVAEISKNPPHLPLIEALKLMLNRGMGLFFAKQYLESGSGTNHLDFINRNIHKAYQAMGEAILVAEGEYHWSNLHRISSLKELNIAKYFPQTSLPSEGFLSLFMQAMDFKLKPSIPDTDEGNLQTRLQEAIKYFSKLYYTLWAVYFKVEQLDYQSFREYLSQNALEENSTLGTAKNILLNLRDSQGKHFSWLNSSRYPRYRLFYALPWLLWGDEIANDDVCIILGMPLQTNQAELQNRFVSLWQRYN